MKREVKKVDERVGLHLLFLAIILFIPFLLIIGTGWKNVIWDNFITGAATSQTTTASVTINAAPTIIQVSPIASQTITEGGTTAVIIRLNITDAEGISNGTGSAQIRVNFSNDPDNLRRFNTTCDNESSFGNITQFRCTVNMWYFDSPGNWTINASANDSSGIVSENHTTSFELQQTTAMTLGPTALTWSTLELGQLNRTSNNDPITLNNTGNKNISNSGITVSGKDLRGLTTLTEHIGVANFSVAPASFSCTQGGPCGECNGTMLFNGSSGGSGAKPVINANMTRGNNTINNVNSTSGQEDLYFCLVQVAAEITRQTYDTTSYGSWTIAVS